MQLELSSELLETTQEFHSVLESMNVSTVNKLFSAISAMRECGVDGFGYRSIDKAGKSNVFSTSKAWFNIPKDQAFFKAMSEHMSAEVRKVLCNNQKYITRAEDKQDTSYLYMLSNYGLNNSFIRYNLTQDEIELYFFITSTAQGRDLILNNLQYLNGLADSIHKPLRAIVASQVFEEGKKPLLEENVISLIWQRGINSSDNKRGKIKVDYLGHIIYLSTREVQCLVMAGIGVSNKTIANTLDISELTVKDYIARLRDKFAVISRDQLVFIARQPELNYLSKLIKLRDSI